VNAFEAVPLRGLDEASKRRIEAAGHVHRLAPGEALFERGDDADDLFIVLRGRVRVGAEGTVLRTAEPGHTLGEEAMLGLLRRAAATAEGHAEVFGVTASLLHRAWTRAGGRPAAAAERRRLERSVIADLLRERLPELDGWALDILLDGAVLRTVEADTFLARAGDPTPVAAFVLDGVVHVRRAGGRSVQRVLTGSDTAGVDAALAGEPWSNDLVAAGTCQVAWIRAEALQSGLGPAGAGLGAASLARAAGRTRVLEGMQVGPRPEPVDVHRLARARSLLVIDQDACVRCGQCTRACASNHDDGIARMTRSGPRMLARLGAPSTAATPWLLAQACQHCTSPACLPDCPTAAITRGPDGVVQIDPALCTGCGACAKACPWDAVEMAVRPASSPAPPPPASGQRYESVAVKCDLCVGARGGPACASACPTEALVRVDAAAEMVEAAALVGRSVPEATPSRSRWPWIGSVSIAVMLAAGAWGAAQRGAGWTPGAGPGLWMGWVAGAALIASLGYAGLRRRAAGRGPRGLALHGVLGTTTLAGAWAHGGGRFVGQPGVFAGVVMLAVMLGLYGLFAYRILPSRLTRLEHEAGDERESIPDDADALMRAVGGRSDALKRLTVAVLLPYARRIGGGALLLVSGRSLRDEVARLRAQLETSLGEARVARMEGVDEVLATVVSVRAARARRVVRGLLRGWLAPHVVLSGVGFVLLVVHGFTRGVL
jgi:Fe-S-cluster-containing dehydrogenase component/CRP-like cAMP-binding protein